MTDQQKLLIIGVGSKSDLKALNDVRLGDDPVLNAKSIDDYTHEKGIKVYQHPIAYGCLITSIHRTTENTIGYAHDTRKISSLDGYRIAATFFGKLAFAMPGVFAAEAPNVPVIGVGGDEDAFYNLYKIPDGTAVGAVGVNRLAHGIVMAEKILDFNPLGPYQFFTEGNCQSEKDVMEELSRIGHIPKREEYTSGDYKGMTICLTDNPDYLVNLDNRVEFGIFGLEKKIPTSEAMRVAYKLHNSLLVGRPKNLAQFAARVIAQFNPEVNRMLISDKEDEKKAYPERVPIEAGHFK